MRDRRKVKPMDAPTIAIDFVLCVGVVRSDKYAVYDHEKHSLPVRVCFACLEHVLIPFDEREEKTWPSHLVGVLPFDDSKWAKW